jgi:DNA-binding NarL/FixJ family response regulator
MPVSIVIYEDNTRLRQSLELLLSDGMGFKVVGAFSECIHAVKQMEELLPSLVIMDIDMPGIDGIEGVKMIKSVFPDIKVIMHTVFEDDNRIFESICAGADGYLLKNTSPLQFVKNLEEVMQGGAPMSPFVAQKVFNHFRKQALPLQDPFNLTDREKIILDLLVKGNSYKMIASDCSITLDTVKKHLHNIYQKLQVSCGTEAVAKALQHKIVKFN